MRIHLPKINNDFTNQYLLYTRRSTDDADNQKNSIEYQIAEGKRFIEKEQIPLADVTLELFCENGIIKEHHSGFKEKIEFEISADGSVKQWVDRPKFLVLADLLLKRKFKGVVCLCWDRISRNEADDVIIKKLELQGVDVRFVQVSYNKSSSGWLHKDIDGAFSRHYSRTISEKVKQTANKMLSEGKCIFRSAIGYLDKGADNKPFDPERAPIIKRIFELYSTGDWSYTTLAQWASKQGLLTKPSRRKRTLEERMNGIPVESIPKVCRPLTAKSIEHILNNPFYIGKIKYKNQLLDSTSHDALIDDELFYKVKAMQKAKTQTIHYPNLSFFTYRGVTNCLHCRRAYTPYIQKGITYYLCRCKSTCINTLRNINEKQLDDKVLEVLKSIPFTQDEINELNEVADVELNKIAERASNEKKDAVQLYNKINKDLEYLKKERFTLLRTGAVTVEGFLEEQARLISELEAVKEKISSLSVSPKVMLDCIFKFSDLIKAKIAYFIHSLDSDKRDIINTVFFELSLLNETVKFSLKSGFKELWERKNNPKRVNGVPTYLFFELERIYEAVKDIVQNDSPN